MAALPRKTILRSAVIGAAALIVVGAGAATIRALQRTESPAVQEEREFRDFLRRLSSPNPAIAELAVSGIAGRSFLAGRPERIAEMVSIFSGKRLEEAIDAGRLETAKNFWRGILELEDRSNLRLLSQELGRLRHGFIAAAARGERPSTLAGLGPGAGGPRIRKALGDLSAAFFGSVPTPPEVLGSLLWDRANLEEMAGRGPEALDAYRALDYNRVRGHWEFSDSKAYLVAKADLLGRIRRLFSMEDLKKDPALAEELEAKADRELLTFRAEEKGAMEAFLDGSDLLHRDDPFGAAMAFDRYLIQSAGDPKGGAPSVPMATRQQQLGSLLRAQARRESARTAFQKAWKLLDPPKGMASDSSRLLVLKRSRLLAGLRLKGDFDAVCAEIPRESQDGREDHRLLSALAGTVWGDRQRSAAELKDLLAARDDLPDSAVWMDLAGGIAPPVPRALFEVGQISDAIGDLPLMEKTIGHLESAIETETDEVYLVFLRSILQLRQRHVVEAWNGLESLLDREFPTGLGRQTVARCMEGVESAADLLGRARGWIESAERDLAFLRTRQETIPAIAKDASIQLWMARTEGEAIDPARFGPRRQRATELLVQLRSELEAQDRRSYNADRSWIDLRNSAASSFQDLVAARRLDAALERLGDLRALLGAGARKGFQIEEAEVCFARAEDLEASGNLEGSLMDLHRSGALLLDVIQGGDESEIKGTLVATGKSRKPMSGRSAAAQAFEQCGDLDSVVQVLAPVEETSTDVRYVLLVLARALLEKGDLNHAWRVLKRILEDIGSQIQQVVEEPGDPVLVGGHHFTDLPADLLKWLEVLSYVDPINGTGAGRLRYDSLRRTLQWRSPGESRFGRPVFIAEGEMARLASGDDAAKSIFVMPRRAVGREVFPLKNGEWDLMVTYREAPVDPDQAEARLLLGEATLRLARLRQFPDPGSIDLFVDRHLQGGKAPKVKTALTRLVEKHLGDLFADPAIAAALKGELDRATAIWRLQLQDEKGAYKGQQERRIEWIFELERELDDLAAATGDPARLRAVLGRDIPLVQEKLRGFHGKALRLLLAKEATGASVRATLEELSRNLLDDDARDGLVFLCEIWGNRNLLWKRAMYLRALQEERRAEEAARAAGDREILGAPPDPKALLESARELYERLLQVSELSDGPQWIGRAILALARIEARAGRLGEAQKWLDRLADADVAGLGRRLLPAAQAQLEGLARTAAFARADLALRSADFQGAIRWYTEAIQHHGRSCLALWGHLQLGACYEAQGLIEEAYREYRKGKLLLDGDLAVPGKLEHWFGEERPRLAEGLRRALPADAAARTLAILDTPQTGTDRAFWNRLFDERLKALPGGR